MKSKTHSTAPKRERAILVQVILGRRPVDEAEDSLAELERLADTAGAEVLGHVTQRRERPAPGLLIGKGKLEDVSAACEHANADVVIFDNELSAIQVNNLDIALGVKVIDRTELILQIFARRAQTAEARVQVELAQLQYLVGRMPTSIKQARFTGGIGMRGPGESPLQLRREPMRRRIRELKRRLEAIREQQARTRERRPWPKVCLVGYTNAGKSTLLNSLSKARAYVDDRLFATLDTKTRLVHAGDGLSFLLTDTVGFIRHLPHGLVASFRSTLNVAVEADLLLLVVDSSHPFAYDHIAVSHQTLREIGADSVPALLVLNKSDIGASIDILQHAAERYPNAVPISASSGEGIPTLLATIRRELKKCCPYWRPPSETSTT